jgi:hypothetical protein
VTDPAPIDPRLTADAQARRRKVLQWLVPVVVGVPLAAALVALTALTSSTAAWLLLGVMAVGAAVALGSRAADRRRRERLAPADPALRAEPALDADRVRAAGAHGGVAGAVREVRHQAPWLTLAEAVDLANRRGLVPGR